MSTRDCLAIFTEIIFNPMKTDELLDFDYEKNKKEIFDNIVKSIDSAMKKNSQQIYIKKLMIVDEEIDVVARREDWPICLDKAINFYKQIEDYESCANCQRSIIKNQ
jgi:hypothetical protein